MLAVSLAVSAVIHLLALAIYPVLVRRSPALPPTPAVQVGPRFDGTQLLRIVELAPGEREQPAPPLQRPPPPTRRTPSPAAPPAETEPGAAPAQPAAGEEARVPSDEELRSAAERLRPRAHDLRLWAPLPPDLTRLTDEQRMKLDLALKLAGVADSLEAATLAARTTRDWLFTDANGKTWGVGADGLIHLGDITIPIPVSFRAPPDPSRGNDWQWKDIDQAAGAQAVRESQKERAKAIRERVDKERQKLRRGTAERPDTAGAPGR